MPGDFQVICGSMLGKNRWSPASSETLYSADIFIPIDTGVIKLNLRRNPKQS